MSRVDDMARLRAEMDAFRGQARKDAAERRRLLGNLRKESLERKKQVAKFMNELRRERTEVTRKAMEEARRSKSSAVSDVVRLRQEVARLRRQNQAENEAARRAWLRLPPVRRDAEETPRRRR